MSSRSQRKQFYRDHVSKRMSSWKKVNTKVPSLLQNTSVKTLKSSQGKQCTKNRDERCVVTKDELEYFVHRKDNPEQERGCARHLIVVERDESGKNRPIHYKGIASKNAETGKYECCGASFVSGSSGQMSLGSVRTMFEANHHLKTYKTLKKLPYLFDLEALFDLDGRGDYGIFKLQPSLTVVGSEVGPWGVHLAGILPQHCIIDNTGDVVTVTPYPQAKVMLCY